jgi:hypothetical protein
MLRRRYSWCGRWNLNRRPSSACVSHAVRELELTSGFTSGNENMEKPYK